MTWSSDLCSSDLARRRGQARRLGGGAGGGALRRRRAPPGGAVAGSGEGDATARHRHGADPQRERGAREGRPLRQGLDLPEHGPGAEPRRGPAHLLQPLALRLRGDRNGTWRPAPQPAVLRSDEHTFSLQSLLRISYALFWYQKI